MEGQKIETTATPMTSCRKTKINNDATFLEDLKDHIDEFIHASMDDHKNCFKNKMNKMVGMAKKVKERTLGKKEEEGVTVLPLQTTVSK